MTSIGETSITWRIHSRALEDAYAIQSCWMTRKM